MQPQKIFFLLIFAVFFSLSADAQCAMCQAVAETSTKTGSTVATGLNGGILYLMVFPYLILSVIGYAMYRHKKAQRAKLGPEE